MKEILKVITEIEKEKVRLKARVNIMESIINGLQHLCDHDENNLTKHWKAIGNDGHYEHYECEMCKKRIKI